MRDAQLPHNVLIGVLLALAAIVLSRWTLSGGDQHDEVPVVCTLVVDAGVLAWLLLTGTDHYRSRHHH